MRMKLFFLSICLFSLSLGWSQIDNFRFKKYLSESPNLSTSFAIPYQGLASLDMLRTEGIEIKNISKNWIFIQTTASEISRLYKENKINNFYFEFHNAQALSDTARIVQHIQEVQDGYGELIRGYSGDNVLMGFVDTGIDWKHPDFIDENGVSRVIAYWKQGAPVDTNTPYPYNYGSACDSLSIANATCPFLETTSGHGSTVAGAAAGNGRANGQEKGMAPKVKIVAIETNFSLQNWTLTVADACDYLFKIADQMGVPAVMNLSVGDYYGSHDGNDPASELMEQMLDTKRGRVIVGAMGNSGGDGKYHLKGKIYQDTNFVWFRNNPTNQIKSNSVYFNWWSDTANSKQLQIAFCANDSTTFEQTPYTQFYKIGQMPSGNVDTLKKANGDVLGVVEIYKTLVGNSYEIEALIRDYDVSKNYFQLAVTGIGEFDLWSGKWSDLNDMITDLPDEQQFPPINKYLMPDSLSTMVSSWACSEKMITVGNLRNRLSHIDNNGNVYNPGEFPPVGYIANSSSRGPTRKGFLKPDVVSSGDMMLASAPTFMRNNPAYNSVLELGGWHGRNGGTSMASPVVAGVAALYLEKCPTSSYKDFIRDVRANTDVYEHYGQMPNYTYGNGRINGYKTLVHVGSFSNDFGYCGSDFTLGLKDLDSTRNFQWSTGETTSEIIINQPDTISVSFEYGKNCYASLTKVIKAGLPPVQPTITANGNVLTSSTAIAYQWYKDGVKMEDETNQSLILTSGGNYQVKISDSANCSNYSEYYHSTLSIENLLNNITIHPNPTHNSVIISGDINIEEYQLMDLRGVVLKSDKYRNQMIDLSDFSNGYYILQIKGDSFSKAFKLLKQ